MSASTVHFAWLQSEPCERHLSGVSLHSHTLHSEECLSFLPRYLCLVPGISQVVRGYQHRRDPVDFERAFWTPPLTPASALRLERNQIADLGMRPLVSITDHDNIDAGLSLRVTADPGEVPISVEWTVPYQRSIFHLGIHNLPINRARSWMEVMAAYTADPDEAALPGILSEFAKRPEMLLVLNHPFWLEEGCREADHRPALDRLLRTCGGWLHAFELNGTRGWRENAEAIRLADAHRRPVISGGDRHACEPSACINLTHAQSFSEFAAEVRSGQSTLLFLPQYQETMAVRILEASWDILRPYPEYPGRERWTDRFFYRDDAGVAQPLSRLWQGRVPWMLRGAAGVVQFFATSPIRQALRLLAAESGELAP